MAVHADGAPNSYRVDGKGYLPEIWVPDGGTERMRRLVARRYQVVRHRTRIKNEIHAILHAHLIAKCPHADLFNGRGRDWLARQPVPDDERLAIDPRVRQSGVGAAHHGRISKVGRSHARAMMVEAAWAAAKTPGPLHAFFVRIRAGAAIRWPPLHWRAS